MAKNNLYRDSLNSAKEQLLDSFILSKEEQENIITSVNYVSNWNGFTKKYEDFFKDDTITITASNNKEYNFSKKHFLENKFFCKSLGIKFKKLLDSDVYTKIIIKDNNLILKLTKSRNRSQNKIINNNIKISLVKSKSF